MSMGSLTTTGTPAKGPSFSPAARRRSIALASSSASGFRKMMALYFGLWVAIQSRQARTRASAVNAPLSKAAWTCSTVSSTRFRPAWPIVRGSFVVAALLIKTFLQACTKFDEVQRSHAAVSRATSDELCQIIDGSAERNSANNAKSAPRGGYRIFTQLHSTNDGCTLHLARISHIFEH